MSASSLIGHMPQFSAISTGTTRRTNHFQRLLTAYKIKDNGPSPIAFNIYHYLVPNNFSDLMPCECPLFWLCVASETLLMLSLEYILSCLPMLFLSYNAALLQDTGCDP